MAAPRTAEVLSRWAALFPGTPLPLDASQMSQTALLQLADRDPELHSLIVGTAPAEVELAVLQGNFSPTPPDLAAPGLIRS